MPNELHQIGAQALAVDQRYGLVVQTVDANAVPALLDKFAGEQVGAKIGEDIQLLQLDHHGAAPRRGQIVVEIEELRRQQCRDVEVEADVAGNGDVVGLAEHRQHAAVEGLGEVLEKPAVGHQVGAGKQRLPKILDRHEQFAEHGFRRPFVADPTDELAAH